MSETDYIKSQLELMKIMLVGNLGAIFYTGNTLVQNYPNKYCLYSIILIGFCAVFLSMGYGYIKIAKG